MPSAWHGEEPELCTEPVWLECEVCGKRVQADEADMEDEDDFVCFQCLRKRHSGDDTDTRQ